MKASLDRAKNLDRLILAAEDGDVQEVDALLRADTPLALLSEPEFGWTALHRAAQFSHVEVVRSLLRCGANPSARDKRRNTPLHDAAMGYYKAVPALLLLIRHGADVDARNSYWHSPLMTAVERSNLPGFLVLLGAGSRTDFRDRMRMSLIGLANYQLDALPKGRRHREQRLDLERILETAHYLDLVD